MQDDITNRQVVQAATAFALVFVIQSLYAWRRLIQSLFGSVNEGRETWLFFPDSLQCSFSVAWFFFGLLLATLFGIARAGRLAYEWELFLAWQGISTLATEFFLITVKVYSLHSRLVDRWQWLTGFHLLGMAIYIAHVILGLWQVTQRRPEVLWASPAVIHFNDFILALMCLFQYRKKFSWHNVFFWRLVSWVSVSLVAFSLSVVGAVCGWDSQHLVQCASCVAVVLEHIWWKWSRSLCYGRNFSLASKSWLIRCRGSQGGISQQTV